MQRDKRELEVLIESPWMFSVAVKKWHTDREMTVDIYRTPQRQFRLRSRKPVDPKYKGEDEVMKSFGNITTWNHKAVEREVEKLKMRYPMKLKIVM